MPKQPLFTIRKNRRAGYTVKKNMRYGYSYYGEIFNYRGKITGDKIERAFFPNKDDATWTKIIFKRK